MGDMFALTSEELLKKHWRKALINDGGIERHCIIPPKQEIEIIPHHLAPMFSSGGEGLATMRDLLTELSSTNPQINQEVLELTRQASLVSLYFFLKVVAAYSGPYADLTDHIHVEMANFKQSMLFPGSRGAAFVPRSFYKTTIFTSGGSAWEALRDPNIRIGLCRATADMASESLWSIQRIFDSNDLIGEIFPEYVPRRGQKGQVIEKRWNNSEMVLPNRTVQMSGATVKPVSTGAAVAGNHFDLFCVDDLISEAQLNAEMTSSADMEKAKQWFMSNQDTLLISPFTSRIFLSATRYAVDDAYEPLMSVCKEQKGYWENLPYEVNPKGKWSIYYRQAIEDGLLAFPEKVDVEFLEYKKAHDFWGYNTQYLNNPYSAQVNEFSTYEINECGVDIRNGEAYIHFFEDGQQKEIAMSQCETIIGVDPAASEKKNSAKTSQTAICVRVKDGKNRRFVIDGIIGYFGTLQSVNEIFRLSKKWGRYLKMTTVEAQGPFKMFYDLLKTERRSRGAIPLRDAKAGMTDKIVKIRNCFQPILERNQLFIAPGKFGDTLRRQIEMFPGGVRLDALDAFELAERYSGYVNADHFGESEYKRKEREIEEVRRIRNVGRAGW